jgi:nucleoside-diphosphate-sugar epimerase
MDRVLVTGGTGFTGSHLVRSLVADGHHVRVLARSAARARDTLPPEVDIVEGDVTDPAVVDRAMRGRQVVHHLAAAFREAGIPDRRYREVHVDGTRLLLEAARAEDVRRFVHCSTIGVHGHIDNPPADETTRFAPGDIYQETKLEGEQLAIEFHRRHEYPVTVARPATIYGPGDLRLLKLFKMIALRRFVVLGSGEVTLHMVYVDDLVRGLRLLADKPEAIGEVFILGGNEYRPLNDIFAIIADAVSAPPPRIHLPVWPVYMLGAVMEKVCIPLKIEPPIYRRRVGFFTKSRAFSIAKAERLIGYRPEVSVEAGIRQTAAWYREQGHLPSH